jgi:glycerophosphoryl diester phosphodiesterase
VSVWSGGALVVGHRGGRGEGWPPENTLAAFEQARRQGALAVELDVRTCAGGEVVVEHDPTLLRATGGRDLRRVSDVGRVELVAMGLSTLTEVLAWARTNGVAVNVEMKHDVPNRIALVRETVRVVRRARADVLLSSFDPLLLAAAAAIAYDIPRALLVHSRQAFWARGLERTIRPPAVSALHLERAQVRPGVVARHVRHGLRLGVWTVNDPRDAADLIALGVATIITDSPGSVLRSIGPVGPA